MPSHVTRRVVSLPRPSPTVVAQAPVPLDVRVEEAPAAHEPYRSSRFEIASAALSRAFGRPVSIGAEVVLPDGFRADQDLVVVYHVPDLGEDPVRVAEHLARLEGLPRLVLVVLDPRGVYGHHAFVDSVNEGPHGEALLTDLIPILEQYLFDGGSARRRFVTGVGLGGWSAIHLQLEYCHAFDAAYAFDPEPLDLRSFYGADLTRSGGAGSAAASRLQNRREGELDDRIASFESALGPRGDDGRPSPLFPRGGGQVDPDVAAAFVRKDPATYVRERGSGLEPRLAGKIHAIARSGDPLGRDLSLRSFASVLHDAGIACAVRTPRSYDLDRAMVAALEGMVGWVEP